MNKAQSSNLSEKHFQLIRTKPDRITICIQHSQSNSTLLCANVVP